ACVQWDDERPTGTVIVSLDDAGQPDYVIVPDVAYDRIEATEPILAEAARADCVCFGTLVQRTAGARATLRTILDAAPATAKLLDINLRKDCYTGDSITASLEQATILKLNDTEAATLADLFDLPDRSIPAFCAEMIGRWNLTHCVVTLGERGAFADGAETDPVYDPGFHVAMVDPLGSGDAFVAAFLCRLLRGEPLEACLHHGNVLGAMVATQAGGTEPIDPEALAAFDLLHTERLIEPSLTSFMIE
ncbi:MAG: carbohydrate kinase family protein, partial [Planctomycetota bacterium]